MTFLDIVLNPIRSTLRTVIYPMRVPIQLLFQYPFPVVFPHHQLKEAKREGKTIIEGRWIKDDDPIPLYLKTQNIRFRGLIGIDMARCTGCRRCERVCPNKIIRMVPREDEEVTDMFPGLIPNLINKKKVYPEIYFGRCLFCGACGEELVGGCPYDALQFSTMFDIADVFDDNLIFTPEKLQQVVEKVGRGFRNFWTMEPAVPKPKKKKVDKAEAAAVTA